MAGNVRIVWSDAAVRAILTSAPIEEALREVVTRVEAAAGEGFIGGVDHGSERSRGYVVTKNQHGQRAEAKDRRLTRALEAGRG